MADLPDIALLVGVRARLYLAVVRFHCLQVGNPLGRNVGPHFFFCSAMDEFCPGRLYDHWFLVVLCAGL
jgi:hypothetical protein